LAVKQPHLPDKLGFFHVKLYRTKNYSAEPNTAQLALISIQQILGKEPPNELLQLNNNLSNWLMTTLIG
jgi:hypothetical protein